MKNDRTIPFMLESRRSPKKTVNNVGIVLFGLANELYNELDRLGIIDRLKEIPQLGSINVKKGYRKSRYDYMMLQLYFHQLVKNSDINAKLEYRDGGKVNLFSEDSGTDRCTLTQYDIIQILSIVTCIGHFYNTFVSSRSVITAAGVNLSLRQALAGDAQEDRRRLAVDKLVKESNYFQVHLLNAMLVLDHCNIELFSVRVAKELLYLYIDKNERQMNKKIDFVFSVFETVRDIAYISYDLPVAESFLSINFCDSNAIKKLLKERLTFYNDSLPSIQMIHSIQKMLSDAVYNNPEQSIREYIQSRRISKKIERIVFANTDEYYEHYWKKNDSLLNKKDRGYLSIDTENILKLTFKNDYSKQFESLMRCLEKRNHICISHYYRGKGENTLLIAVKKDTLNKSVIAMSVLRDFVRIIKPVYTDDFEKHLLLTIKFVLYYVLGENHLEIHPSVSNEKCIVLCNGNVDRIRKLGKLIEESAAEADTKHEAEAMLCFLKQEAKPKRDISILIPSSILVFADRNRKVCKHEFDGIVIFPRRKRQFVFIEAKNRRDKPERAKRELEKKLIDVKAKYSDLSFHTLGQDAVAYLSIDDLLE